MSYPDVTCSCRDCGQPLAATAVLRRPLVGEDTRQLKRCSDCRQARNALRKRRLQSFWRVH